MNESTVSTSATSLPFVDYGRHDVSNINSRWMPIHGHEYFCILDSILFTNNTDSDIVITMKISKQHESPGPVEDTDFVYYFPLSARKTSDFLNGNSFHFPSTDVLYARSGDARHFFHSFVSFRALKEVTI